jgi:hypothetical protein
MKQELKRRTGVAPSAWNSYVSASEMAGIDLREHSKLRVTQSVGFAKASAGYHAPDGTVKTESGRESYCAATDTSVLWLELGEIRAWLNSLAWWGFVGWYRPWTTNGKPNYHLHIIYAGLPMKPQLDRQLVDFLNNRNGLAGSGVETFFTGNVEQDDYIRALWRWSNHGGPKPPAPPKTPKPASKPDFPVNNPYTVILPDGQKLTGIPIDGTAWVSVRDWYGALGIRKWVLPGPGHRELVEAVKWHPATRRVYVQGRELEAPVRLLKVGGETKGHLPIRLLVKFSALKLRIHNQSRILEIAR